MRHDIFERINLKCGQEEEYAMTMSFTKKGILSAVILIVIAASQAAAQSQTKGAKSGQNCVAKCNDQVPLGQNNRGQAVSSCIRACKGG